MGDFWYKKKEYIFRKTHFILVFEISEEILYEANSKILNHIFTVHQLFFGKVNIIFV